MTKSERPPRTRTCSDEVVHRGPGAIVYVGDCKEHEPGQGDRPAQDWEIVTDEVVEDVADWGMRKAKLVRFVARKR